MIASDFSNIPGCMQAVYLDKSGFRHTFPRNLKTAFLEHFRIVVLTICSDQLLHVFSRHKAFLATFSFNFSVDVYISFTFV